MSRSINTLLSCQIRDIKTDERGLLIKLHSNKSKRSFWIGVGFDALYDEDGNHFREHEAPHIPIADRAAAGLKAGLTHTRP
jgi:hypothetical protein